LIVLSQVGAGAEILAEGNIHVYGSLRGRALPAFKATRKPAFFALIYKQSLFRLRVIIKLAMTFKVPWQIPYSNLFTKIH
jgi:septum site-determining protein MinC